jgi:hypothetical protein
MVPSWQTGYEGTVWESEVKIARKLTAEEERRGVVTNQRVFKNSRRKIPSIRHAGQQCGVVSICDHNRSLEAVGASNAAAGASASKTAKEASKQCGEASICEHNLIRSTCKKWKTRDCAFDRGFWTVFLDKHNFASTSSCM